MKKKRSLRKAAIAAIASLAVAATSTAGTGTTNTNGKATKFDKAVNNLSIDFNSYSRMPQYTYAKNSKVRLVQLEGYSPPSVQVDPFGGVYFSGRHGQAAADIADKTAEQLAQMNFNSQLVDYWLLYGLPTGNMARVVKDADILSMSYDANPERNLNRYRAFLPRSGRVQDDNTRADTYKMWSESRAVTVKAAGNGGYNGATSLLFQSEGLANFNDTHLTVGGGFVRGDNVIVLPYSSASQPSVVTLNPYHSGFDYEYYGDRADMEVQIRDAVTNGKMFVIPTAERCSDVKGAVFEGSDLLNANATFLPVWSKYSEEQKAEIKEALINCYLYVYDRQDTTRIEGTSFTTPHMAGMLAAAIAETQDVHGDVLSRHDYVAASFLAAQPIWKAQNRMGQALDLEYTISPAGLPYNDNIAGFGYVDYETLRDQMMSMAEMVKNNPDAKTRATRVDSGVIHFSDKKREKNEDGMAVYEIPVSKSATAVRAIMEFTFNGSHNNRGDVAFLEAPSGERFRITMTREAAGDKYSFAFTNGMFGANTQGTWKLIVPEFEGLDGGTTSLASARIQFSAVERGGVIDQSINAHNENTPAEQEISERKRPKAEPVKFVPVPRLKAA